MTPSPLTTLSEALRDVRSVGFFRVLIQGALTGAAAGALICVFRVACDAAGRALLPLLPTAASLTWASGAAVVSGLLLLCLAGVLLIRRFPFVAGSGIPQVELALAEKKPIPWKSVVAGKFVATWISLTGGLSVGREGPCIYMGAAMGHGLRRLWSADTGYLPRFSVAGSVAGLTAAFGAPLGGLLFAFEEMKTSPRGSMLLCAAMSAFAAAVVTEQGFGFGRVFPFAELTPLSWRGLWLAIPVGLVTGVAGDAFNRLLLGTVGGMDRWATRAKGAGSASEIFFSEYARGLIPFVCVAGLLYAYPMAVDITGPTPMELGAQNWPLAALGVFFVVKVIFSVLSFASGMSGGLLMPILFMGSIGGACLASTGASLGVLETTQYATVLVVCMAGFFGSSVRAPLTGTALVAEMCGAWNCLPELLMAALLASFTATHLGSLPVYDALRVRARAAQQAAAASGQAASLHTRTPRTQRQAQQKQEWK